MARTRRRGGAAKEPPAEDSKRPLRKDEPAEQMGPRVLLAKALAVSGAAVSEASAMRDLDTSIETWGGLGAVLPPYDPTALLKLVEINPHLGPCIQAYAQNIEGYGIGHEPVSPWMADLESEEAAASIRDALAIERWVEAQEQALEGPEAAPGNAATPAPEAATPPEAAPATSPTDQPAETTPEPADDADLVPGAISLPEVTDDEVARARDALAVKLRAEQYIFDAWFKNCCSEMSFTRLRRIVRSDVESNGWGCIEMIRDGYGRLKRLAYVPAYTVRPMVDEGEIVTVMEPDDLTPLSRDREIPVGRRFRRYVQIVLDRKVYFKSPGDPRVVSRISGEVYVDDKALQEAERDEGPDAVDIPHANELLWFVAQHSAQTPCAPPRWIGNLVSVLGGREADEANFYYFKNNSIPPALLLVSGGRVPQAVKDRLEQRIAAEMRGGRGLHKIMVVEASTQSRSPGEKSMTPTLQFQSLRDAQLSDAIFLNYDQRCTDRIGASFRLPPILRGYTPSSLNRATAVASLQFAEQQVFQPERDDVDWVFNRVVLPEIGIKLLRFKSNGPPSRSPEDLSMMLSAVSTQGALVPNELRILLADVLGLPLARIDEAWAKQPMPLTLAGMSGGGFGGGGAPPEAAPIAGSVDARLRAMEESVANIVTEELRAAGLDHSVAAHLVDVPPKGTLGVPDAGEGQGGA